MQLAMEAYRLQAEQRSQEALKCVDEALRLEPEFVPGQFMKGVILLSQGNFKEGWPLYEHRCQRNDAKKHEWRHMEKPWWRGEPTDKKVIIWVAEGMGDAVQMMRFMPEVRERCPNVQLELQQPLVRLAQFNNLAPEIFAYGDRENDFDLQCPILSLPWILGKELKDIQGAPYIQANPRLSAAWRERKPEQLKFGLCWRGNRVHIRDEVRSISDEQIQELGSAFQFAVVSREHANFDDVMDTASLMETLDVVVTVDTLAAHLAGAMGKRTLLMLGVDCDWRWMQNRADTPWYDSVQLIRQKTAGDWSPVLAEVKEILNGIKVSGYQGDSNPGHSGISDIDQRPIVCPTSDMGRPSAA